MIAAAAPPVRRPGDDEKVGGDSCGDVEGLDDVPREVDVGLRRLRVRKGYRDEPGATHVEDVQVPAVGRA